jgi:hypothetical protein
LIPLSGLFGTLVGLALMFWGRVLQGLRKLASLVSTKSGTEQRRPA